MAALPPVVDHVKRSTIQEIASKSPFNIFNIVAVVAILVIGFYLYRKFNQKFARGAIRMPPIPAQMFGGGGGSQAAAAASVVDTVPEPPAVSVEEEVPSTTKEE